MSATDQFIERREAGFYIKGSRVPIDRVVQDYRNGEDPATIQSHYPTLTVEQINGAISFYVNHKDEVDKVIDERTRAEDAYAASHPTPADIKEEFERMRRQTAPRRT